MNIEGVNTVLVGCGAYLLGGLLNLSSLKRLCFPDSVIGAFFLLALSSIFTLYTDITVTMDGSISREYILTFFTIIGMSSKLEALSNNRIFYKILLIVASFLFLQNIVGILSCYYLGVPPIQGLILGSITLAGGHGTAVSWGSYLAEEGLCTEARELGMLFSTLGLISGSITGNLFISKIIAQHNLKPEKALLPVPVSDQNREWNVSLLIKVVFLILGSITLSRLLIVYIKPYLMLPEYLISLFIGIILSQCCNLLNKDNTRNILSVIKEFCLEVCISINIINLKYIPTEQNSYLLLLILLIQIIFILFFSYYVFFAYTGQNYHSAVLTSGFIGSALGSVAIGANNIQNISRKYGEAPAASIFFPYLGSIIFDTLNAINIQFFVIYLTYFSLCI